MWAAFSLDISFLYDFSIYCSRAFADKYEGDSKSSRKSAAKFVIVMGDSRLLGD